jgi:hypothetical protein
MTMICYLWSNANVKWKDANWRWSECFTVPETGSLITPGVDASLLTPGWMEEPWNPYKNVKKDRWIELFCWGEYFEYDAKKEVKIFPLTVKDIKFSMNPSDVDVKFKLEK